MSSEPCPPFFQQWNLMLPSWIWPGQKTRWSGVMAPLSSAASATISLKVDPGGNCPAMALLVSGARGLVIRSFHSCRRQAAIEGVGIEGGRRRHHQDVPGMDVEHHDGGALVAQPLGGELLQAQIDGQIRGRRRARPLCGSVSRMTRPTALTSIAQSAALAAQGHVVDALDPRLADAEAGQLQQRASGSPCRSASEGAAT